MEKSLFFKPFLIEGVCEVEIVTGQRSGNGLIARNLSENSIAGPRAKRFFGLVQKQPFSGNSLETQGVVSEFW
jgi:hypothetical protein